MMAAALAEGRTTILNAACEPEVQDLARFLNACGARIRGIGSPTLVIDGVAELRGTEHTLIPDRIEAGTFLAAAAMAGGTVRLAGARPDHMAAVLRTAQRMGVRLGWDNDALTVSASSRPEPAHIVAAPYPDFPTDMQPQFLSLLCLARGAGSVTDRVYPQRFTHVEDLREMGASVVQTPAGVAVEGAAELHGAEVQAADLRAGALAARGTTHIYGVDQIDRGYQDLEARLGSLGAEVRREEADDDELRRTA